MYVHVHVDTSHHACSRPTFCVLAGAASLVNREARIWDAEYTITISDLRYGYVVSRQFLGILVLLGGVFRDVACNESCASTIDSTGIAWLPFALRIEVNKPAKSKQPYMPAATPLTCLPRL